MATKSEKVIFSVIGIIAGGIIGNNYANKNEISGEDKWKYILGGVVGGGLLGYSMACVLGTSDDTVNYTLVKDGKVVYHGITHCDRVSLREKEHIRSGKSFHRMIPTTTVLPRCEAGELEKMLIKRDKPQYNIIHNCNN